jgi:hypothetical protein
MSPRATLRGAKGSPQLGFPAKAENQTLPPTGKILATHTMAKPTTTTEKNASNFSEAQLNEIRSIVADFLMSDEFDVKLNSTDVVEACKTALQDEDVQTQLSEVLRK